MEQNCTANYQELWNTLRGKGFSNAIIEESLAVNIKTRQHPAKHIDQDGSLLSLEKEFAEMVFSGLSDGQEDNLVKIADTGSLATMRTLPVLTLRVTPTFSVFLDASRWVAAFIVLTTHVRHTFLTDYSQVRSHTVFVQALYLFTSLGHEAVMVFFVLSGFLVGGLTLSQWRDTGVDLASYFVHRVSRIYTVLIPALCLGCGLDYCGYHFFNASHIYTNAAAYATQSLSPSTFQNT